MPGPGLTPPYPSTLSFAPTLPLFPGETVVSRFENSPAGQAKVARYNGSIIIVMMLAIFVPFMVLIVISGPVNFVILLYPALILFFVAMILMGSRRASRAAPTQVFLTDRRVIVQQSGPNASSAAIGLENLGNVEVNQTARASRSAGVAWVYFLPVGTPQAMVGAGRGRHAAPGVLWVPAVPVAQAQTMRDHVLARARGLQTQLGYPTTA